MARLPRDAGAVYVEFLIAFMPLLILFMCLWQMSRMYTTSLAVQHAATTAARSGAVVFADDPANYGGEPVGQVAAKRRQAVEGAALLPLSPFILDGSLVSVKVTFPSQGGASQPGANDERTQFNPSDPTTGDDSHRVDFVRVRVETTFRCRIPLADRIACNPFTRTRTISREAAFPYQGASFTY
jgi:hypothetical protein